MIEQLTDFVVYVRQTSFSHALQLGNTYRVGRGPSAHIRIDDPSVSREHLLIHTSPAGIEIEELGSSNGTLLFPADSTQKVDVETSLAPHKRYKLRAGDVVRIGSVAALLRVQELRSAPTQSTIPPSAFAPHYRGDLEMKRLYELAARAASTDISVLIMGETGTGKELLATFVHQNSSRHARQFLQLNCAALSESLLESELFGHEKGAFTGAVNNRVGLLESTAGGTVFLDEIGEMPLTTQAKLLRVIEERRIRRLGSNKSHPIDVRFVAATNRDMEREVTEGRFRGDLYYRISGIMLHLPALRERPTEIEPLARHFLREQCLRLKIAVPEFTESALAKLLSYDWPGNVRELKNAMERAPILSDGAPIEPTHLPNPQRSRPINSVLPFDDESEEEQTQVIPVTGAASQQHRQVTAELSPLRDNSPRQGAHETEMMDKLVHRNSRAYSVDDEKARIGVALQQCSGNQTRAAKLLGVSRRTLINRLESLDIRRPRKGP